MIRKNLYIVVLLLCSFTNLSAQNESSQFEQDLELIGLNFSLSDQYSLLACRRNPGIFSGKKLSGGR